jgi:tRNA-specific 2-thiouridylase
MKEQKNRFSKTKTIPETRVVVAMSGGVDSSVVAALMHEEGYEVIGITLQLYDYGAALQKKGACCAGQDIEDARQVCEKLGIKHYVLNYESLFKESVMEDFADSYLRGETPIPCVRCNQSVKFRDLFTVAKDLGADALATGHYIMRKEGVNGAELHNAIDANKDQTYFLFATTKAQAEYIHFPLGDMSKAETRKHAERFGLPVFDKPDSQDICFVPGGDYAKVVERIRPGALDKGDIVHVNGQVLGQHNGIIGYTRGQRRGLGVAYSEPLYVIKVEPETKRVIVGSEQDLYANEFYIKEINWLGNGDSVPAEGLEVEVKMRSAGEKKMAFVTPIINDTFHSCESRNPVSSTGIETDKNVTGSLAKQGMKPDDQPSTINQQPSTNLYKVTLKNPERAITPGQACVFYSGTQLLGGGWISGV